MRRDFIARTSTDTTLIMNPPTPTEAHWLNVNGIQPAKLTHPFRMTYKRAYVPLSKGWAAPEMEETLMRWLTSMLKAPRLTSRHVPGFAGGTELREWSTPDGPFGPRDTGYRWQLDSSNDWFAEIDRTTDPAAPTLTLACRYETQPLAALATWVAARVSQ